MIRAPRLVDLAAVGLAIVALGCSRGESTAQRAPGEPVSRMLFEDATATSGLEFQHVTGGTGAKFLPETMGAGVCVFDHDGDGHLDVFLVNSGALPGPDPRPSGPLDARSRLFRGRGDGTFEDVTEASGCGVVTYGMGATAADVDGDGDDDLFITSLGDDILLVNEGGRFRDATAAAGVAGAHWRDSAGLAHPSWSTAAAFVDLDRDGDLDLIVARYVQWTRDLEVFTTIDGINKAFTTPDRYVGLPCSLFANRGDGTFDDLTEVSGSSQHLGKALGLALADFDGDGNLEIFVANDTRPNFVFRVEPGLRLVECGMERGAAYDEDGRARAGMGIDVTFAAPDLRPSVAIGNFSREPLSLYVANAAGIFTPAAHAAGLAGPTFATLTFGLAFADLDLDGVDDLVIVNGHVEPDIAQYLSGESYLQPPQLFQGLHPSPRFVEVGATSGPPFATPIAGRGLAFGDFDEDGDLDLIATTNGGSPRLWRNLIRERVAPRSLRVHLRGSAARCAGALVTLLGEGPRQRRIQQPGGSYLSSSERVLTFGLGSGPSPRAIEVRWADGSRTLHALDPGARRVEIRAP